MRKTLKFITALMMVSVMAMGASAVVMANTAQRTETAWAWACCTNREAGTMGRLMWNEDGTFMSREAFEARLDEMIALGSILESDRAFFLERFDFCSTYRAGATGARGACGRNGRGASGAGWQGGGGRCRNWQMA